SWPRTLKPSLIQLPHRLPQLPNPHRLLNPHQLPHHLLNPHQLPHRLPQLPNPHRPLNLRQSRRVTQAPRHPRLLLQHHQVNSPWLAAYSRSCS
ncbi:MAG TPA: hypothetical protein PKH28_11735, partial [Candidatus Competibacteraceae bacterium]|nr:hypothetical protein [Candidatus Competibacteraceae bacterium]